MPITFRQRENSSIFVAKVGGDFFFLIKATQGKIKESKSSPRVCACIRFCVPAPGRSLSPSPPSLPLVTLPRSIRS